MFRTSISYSKIIWLISKHLQHNFDIILFASLSMQSRVQMHLSFPTRVRELSYIHIYCIHMWSICDTHVYNLASRILFCSKHGCLKLLYCVCMMLNLSATVIFECYSDFLPFLPSYTEVLSLLIQKGTTQQRQNYSDKSCTNLGHIQNFSKGFSKVFMNVLLEDS